MRYGKLYSKVSTLILLALLLLLIASCYGPKQATKQTARALLTYPAQVAALIRVADPCVTLHTDTTTVTNDSLIFVQCPQDYVPIIHDTLINGIEVHDTVRTKRTIYVPVNIPMQTKYITKEIKDSADGVIIADLRDKNATLTLSNAVLKGDKTKWKLYSVISWVVIALLTYAWIKKK